MSYTGYWWVEFNDRSRGCVDAETESEATEIATKLRGLTLSVRSLPYPAEPVLTPRGPKSCPLFCWDPNACAGRTCCPKGRACSE